MVDDNNWNTVPSDDVSRYAPPQHTPGPWKYEFCEDSPRSIDVWGNRKEVYVGFVPDDDTGKAEALANAQLIAQAPTLLEENEALKALNVELLRHVEESLYMLQGNYPFTTGAESTMKALIAKAKGVQN